MEVDIVGSGSFPQTSANPTRAETLAEISRVAAELRDETDEGRRKALEKRLEELEGVESDLLDRRVSTLRGDL